MSERERDAHAHAQREHVRARELESARNKPRTRRRKEWSTRHQSMRVPNKKEKARARERERERESKLSTGQNVFFLSPGKRYESYAQRRRKDTHRHKKRARRRALRKCHTLECERPEARTSDGGESDQQRVNPRAFWRKVPHECAADQARCYNVAQHHSEKIPFEHRHPLEVCVCVNYTHIYECIYAYVYAEVCIYIYALVVSGALFRRISSLLWGSFAKETYDFKEPTNRSNPIHIYICSDYIHCSIGILRKCLCASLMCIHMYIYICIYVCIHKYIYVCIHML